MIAASHGRLHAAMGLLALLCVGVGCGAQEVKPDPDVTTVHGAFLKHTGGVLLVRRMRVTDTGPDNDEPIPAGMYVPEGKTWGDARRINTMEGLNGLRRETWDAYLAANSGLTDLSKSIRFSGTIHWLSDEELDRAFPNGGDVDKGYDRLFRRNPGADHLLGLSMPGISPDGNQALLYVESMSGGEAGSGTYYLLAREGRTWKIVAQHEAWIS
ncbi:MAG: hypothetical protein H6806_08115 [Planctomycetes bacterium]|nr:hypothetical protein [Planctomycetota bacterium]MCB9829709.1 hypothetical protein [Planctomycetota bacterium]MCB9900052.1 hypothetical protein [Planctomycetota bacterium]